MLTNLWIIESTFRLNKAWVTAKTNFSWVVAVKNKSEFRLNTNRNFSYTGCSLLVFLDKNSVWLNFIQKMDRIQWKYFSYAKYNNAWLALGPGPIIIYQIFSLKLLDFA